MRINTPVEVEYYGKINYNCAATHSPETCMALKIRNARRRLNSQPRYATELRLDIELDQGYPLTTAQDIALKQMLADDDISVQVAADRLVALRPKSRVK